LKLARRHTGPTFEAEAYPFCPRLGALYYLKSPQGSANKPIQIGDRTYDNGRHKVFDTYLIPTLSVGYSW
jgi:hypothetical protein